MRETTPPKVPETGIMPERWYVSIVGITLGMWGGERREEHGKEQYHGLFESPSDFEEWWEKNGKGGICLPLYLYDHSGITISCGPFSCPWDSGQVGYVFITREEILYEWGNMGKAKVVTKKMREQAENVLRGEVETYDQYLTGEVYGYIIEDEDGNELDACWGFYGEECCLEEAKSSADYWAEKMVEGTVGAGI